jgi:sulfoxide reductase heme-binding subunit YedZ
MEPPSHARAVGLRRVPDAIHAFLKTRWFYGFVFAGCALPLAMLLYRALPVLLPAAFPDLTLPWPGDLGVNPVETLEHTTGRDALGVLFAALAVTPIRRLTGWNRVQVVRRTVGVWAFVYALCHFTVYLVFDQLVFSLPGGALQAVIDDVTKRRFIFVGMLAFVILLVLAATSTNGMIRRLGRRWQRLHRLVYVAAVAGVIHFTWGQKADIREPLVWAAGLAVLLGFRVVLSVRKRRRRLVSAVTR